MQVLKAQVTDNSKINVSLFSTTASMGSLVALFLVLSYLKYIKMETTNPVSQNFPGYAFQNNNSAGN